MKRSSIFLLLILLIILPLISQFCLSDKINQITKLFDPLLPPKPGQQDVAIVAALDGTVHLVDTNLRKIRWSFPTGSPIYSSYQARVSSDDDKHNGSGLSKDLYYVDCGDDWELYVHSQRFGKLRKLSLSADEYIRMTPHVSDDGEITLGLKKTTAFLVDAKTGRVVRTYKFDNSASKVGVQVSEGNAVMLSKDAGELVESGDVDLGALKHLVYITRTDYVLQHYSPNSTEILWNVAFADIEGEFRCQGIQSTFGGVPPNANEDTDENEWQLPCQMKTVALRIRDHGTFDFDKLAITYLGGGASFLPVPDNKPHFGHIPRFQPALPTSGDMPMLALPSSEGKNPGILAPFSGNSGVVNAISTSSENIAKSHAWPVITAILSITGFIFYKYLASRKQGELNKPIEEFQPHFWDAKKEEKSEIRKQQE
ncbi:SERINE/THREONINE-PROTEIN KINASE/ENDORIBONUCLEASE IRE1B [Salix purpurea]|uniref:SERINE/THREONINE-PROTEIN KINASE/ENDORIBONUCLEASE IRE1B n=1 Tax=Salix purpurea TaxID=77065 RepID=A0A9Q0WX88_SALPP|nr:SERINE/THREONINE-PROTEIN KINASE/ENDORIBONUCLEASE IRE1B [Salix purpurea]